MRENEDIPYGISLIYLQQEVHTMANEVTTNYTPYGTNSILDNLVHSLFPQTRQEVAEQGYGLDALADDEDKGVLLAVIKNCNNDIDILSRVYSRYDEDLRLAIAIRASGELLEKMCNEGSYNVRFAAYTHKRELLEENKELNAIEYASEYGDITGAIYLLTTQYLDNINEHIELIENKQDGVRNTKEYGALLEEKAELYRIKTGLLDSLSPNYRFYSKPEYVSTEENSISKQEARDGVIDKQAVTFNIGHITDSDILSLSVTVKTLADNTIISEPSDFSYRAYENDKPYTITLEEGENVPEKTINDCLSLAEEKVVQQEHTDKEAKKRPCKNEITLD